MEMAVLCQAGSSRSPGRSDAAGTLVEGDASDVMLAQFPLHTDGGELGKKQ